MARTPVILAAVAAVAAAAVTIAHSGDEVYGIPGWGVAVTVALAASAVGGCGLVLWSRQWAFGSLVIGAAALAVLGALAILSFGILALAAAVVLILAAASDRWKGPRRAFAGAAGAIAGAALPLLVVFALGDPVVDCRGLSGGENFFMSFGGNSASASASDSPDGTARGTARGSNYEYSYECRGDELVKFDLRWR